MPQNRSIRAWIFASVFLSVIGALFGGIMCAFAIERSNRTALSSAAFERNWAIAEQADEHANILLRTTLAQPSKVNADDFIAHADERLIALNRAHDAVPRSLRGHMIDNVQANVQARSAYEIAAIELAMAGHVPQARAKLAEPIFKALSADTAGQYAYVRDHFAEALAKQRIVSANMMFAGLLTLFTFVILSGLCWWRVGQFFSRQAKDLSMAHAELEDHTALLEIRIGERTRDLENAKAAAESADHAKSAFLAQMSHEIRTPMNGVLGMAEALANTPMNDRQSQMLQVIRESGATLLTLLNDVLDLAKIEAGKLDLENTSFRCDELVRSAEAVFTSRAHEKGISLAISTEGDTNAWCMGDPTRLRQVLYNLVSNAVKFTENGGVNISLLVGELHDGKRHIQFKVKDSGIGMEDHVRERLFERFSQADASTTRKFGGTGLGLAICRQLLSLMGGTITVESTPGDGSTFHVGVTLDEAAAPGVSITDHEEVVGGGVPGEEGGEVRILAAEDNAHNRLVLQLMLEQIGLEATFAHDGQEALNLWQSQPFDLILMDVQMPVMGGPEATRRIREIEVRTGKNPIPIIALTANAMTHHVKECLDAGMDAHVSKPIRADVLFATMQRLLIGDEEGEEVADDADSVAA